MDYTDIAEYRNIVKNADESLESVDNLGQSVIVSFKQINGHAAVVESIRKKGNELAFKSMYFENGGYKNSNAYKNAVENPKGNPSPAPYGYEPHADANTPPKVDTEHYTTRPLINKPITNQNDGRVAQISRKNIAKMTSDKAVAKSVANGFEPAEHFKAVQEVDKLYQNAVFKQSEKDPKNNDPALIIHRYNDESIARRRTDLPSSQGEAEKTTSANASVDSTTKTFNQADIKLESLQDFASYARLAGFENLSPRELESAHKHILANLEKLRC